MDIVIGNKSGIALHYGGKLMGLTGTELPYFLTSIWFNSTPPSTSQTEFSATIEYADGTSRTATISPNTSYTYDALLNGNSTYITRIGDIELYDYNTGAHKANYPSSFAIMSKYPILRSVRHMINFNTGNGKYPSGHNPINLLSLNTLNVTDFSEMFYGQPPFWYFDKLDLSHLNTSNGQNFKNMIPYVGVMLSSTDSAFRIDLSGFDMSKAVTQDSYDIFGASSRLRWDKPIVFVEGCESSTVAKIKWSYQNKLSDELTVSETTVDGKHALVAVEVTQ